MDFKVGDRVTFKVPGPYGLTKTGTVKNPNWIDKAGRQRVLVVADDKEPGPNGRNLNYTPWPSTVSLLKKD